MVKFNQELSEMLSTVFLLRACSSCLQNTFEPLLGQSNDLHKMFFKAMYRKVNTKSGTKSLALIGSILCDLLNIFVIFSPLGIAWNGAI